MLAKIDCSIPSQPPTDGEAAPLMVPLSPPGCGISAYESIDDELASNLPTYNGEALPWNKIDSPPEYSHVASVIPLLFLGIFIAAADASLLVATNGNIASEFGRLQDGSWLINAYILSMCAIQPIYGKLGDIYGTKPCLLIAYAFFAFGCLICGLAFEIWEVIFGRAVSGIGGAGMISLVSVIISDIAPKRDVASWRSYVNLCVAIGTSLGGPMGGFMVDTIGWRWMFFIQAPLTALAAILVIFGLNIPHPDDDVHFEYDNVESSSFCSKFGRIDFLGTFFLAASIVASILLLNLGGRQFNWISIPAFFLASTSLIFATCFMLVEVYIAKEPIICLHLLRKSNVVASYLITFLQISAQFGLMFCVPLYFQVTARSSATAAGAHLIPAIMGNATGGIFVGALVKHTGRYKAFIISAGLIASITYIFLLLFWNGSTGFWGSLYIIPGGFGTGVVQTAVFVAMSSKLEPRDIAMATGGLFLSQNIGMVGGIAMTTTALQSALRQDLIKRVQGKDAMEIINRAMSDVRYIETLEGDLREIIVSCYVAGLKHTYIVSLLCALLAFAVSLTLREHRVI